MNPLLDVKNLYVRFKTPDGTVTAVNDLNFTLNAGSTLGIVGESGSGKSQTAFALMGLLAANGTVEGSAIFEGKELVNLPKAELNKIRAEQISMIFQDPMTSLNPYMKIGEQLMEVLQLHKGYDKQTAFAESVKMLDAVKMPEAKKRMGMYPHEFSGGMRQRVMIAMALLCRPKLLIADEPTTALDVTIQAQILELMQSLQKKLGITFVYITHDQEEAINMSDRIAVMRGGRFEQIGTPEEIYDEPKTHYVAQFIGRSTILSGKVESVGKDTAVIRGACGSFTADASRARLSAGEDCEICVRTERMRVSPVPVEGFQLSVTVREARYAGGSVLTYAILPDGEEAVATSEGRLSDALTPGSTAYLYWNPAQAAVIGGTSHGA